MARGHTNEAKESMARRIMPGDLVYTMESAMLDSMVDSMVENLLGGAPAKDIDED